MVPMHNCNDANENEEPNRTLAVRWKIWGDYLRFSMWLVQIRKKSFKLLRLSGPATGFSLAADNDG
jgi:hypothetical protein